MNKETVSWQLASRVTNDSRVDEYIRALIADPNNDNAVCLVRLIMEIERNKSYGATT